MLSGILFSIDLLPKALRIVGTIFPATWGYTLMADDGFSFSNLWPLAAILLVAVIILGFLLKKLKSES